MPHQCVRCGKFHEDGSTSLLEGCECGSKFFFFVRQKNLDKAKEVTLKLDATQRQEIEKDVVEMMGGEPLGKPVILDLESIRVTKPGQYEISLIDLFNNKPIVYKMGEGKYIVDLVQTFKSVKGD